MKTYDPATIISTFGSLILLAPAAGTFVTAERTADAFSLSPGSKGTVTRVRNRNRTGVVTITLQAESPSNGALSTVHSLDELFGTGVRSLQIKDLNGTTLIHAESAWIRKNPMVEFSDDASNREWQFDCEILEITLDGALA